jgi:hypothetical protein
MIDWVIDWVIGPNYRYGLAEVALHSEVTGYGEVVPDAGRAHSSANTA